MSSSIDLECVGSEVLKLSRSLSLQFHSKSTFPLSKVLLILLRARTTKQASTYLVYSEAISQVCNIIILRRANNLVEPVVEKPMWFYPLNPCQMPNFKLNPFNLVPPNTRRRPNKNARTTKPQINSPSFPSSQKPLKQTKLIHQNGNPQALGTSLLSLYEGKQVS